MPKVVVTGGAGFIGSNLVERLLRETDYDVVVIDNLFSGSEGNLNGLIGPRCSFHKISIEDAEAMAVLCQGAQAVIHLAAVGSVPRSFADPATTHAANTTGFLNVLLAAKAGGAKRFLYASSSSVYGDSPVLPKKEENLGNLLSPYAATKKLNEDYARLLLQSTDMVTVGFRFFNVFGPRQSPDGAYAAVIPRFIAAAQASEPLLIYGDGLQTRDFTYVDNVTSLLRGCLTQPIEPGIPIVANVGCGAQTDLLSIAKSIITTCKSASEIVHQPGRTGDIRDSLADITIAKNKLGYNPVVSVDEGLAATIAWHKKEGSK